MPAQFVEEFYAEYLVPRIAQALGGAGLALSVDPSALRVGVSAVEVCAALLLALNYRRPGALLALGVVALGTKNMGLRTVRVAHLGSAEVFPVALVHAALASLVLLLPTGRPPTAKPKRA